MQGGTHTVLSSESGHVLSLCAEIEAVFSSLGIQSSKQ